MENGPWKPTACQVKWGAQNNPKLVLSKSHSDWLIYLSLSTTIGQFHVIALPLSLAQRNFQTQGLSSFP